MANSSSVKKRIVTNFTNLTTDLQSQVKLKYPTGFSDYMMRIDKPDGTFFYAVSYETDEIAYLVKINVKVDAGVPDDEYKDYYEDDIKESDDDSQRVDSNDDDME